MTYDSATDSKLSWLEAIRAIRLQEFLARKMLYTGLIDGELGPLSNAGMLHLLGHDDHKHWTPKRLRIGTMQTMCLEAEIDPGPIDGIMGPMTRGAIALYEALQDGRGTEPDKKDPLRKSVKARMPWLERAQQLVGTREIAGKRHNPVILGWAKDQGLWYPNDEIAWCGLFVSHCIHFGLPEEPQPENPLGARQWLKFGEDCKPQLGSVLIFWRGKRSGWTGHVGFYVGEDAGAFHVLGGNQSNAVNIKRLAKDRLLGARWPVTAGDPPDVVRLVGANGRLSVNEA